MDKLKVAVAAIVISGLLIFQPIVANSMVENDMPFILSVQDREYLAGVLADTLSCLEYFTNDKTGFPYDVSDYRRPTSITNIGLYVASVAVASKIDLIAAEKAVEKIKKILDSIEKIEKWRGFPVSWVDVDAPGKTSERSFSYADHVGNLVCGLLVAQGVFQKEFDGRIDEAISKMDFFSAYDEKTGWLKGGYDISKKDFQVLQSWGSWYYNLYASDTRHFSLMAMLIGKIPQTHWQKLLRNKTHMGRFDSVMSKAVSEKINDSRFSSYYAPGMEGGGLFMQYLPGIFFDEKALPIGKSASNLARCQIEFSKTEGFYPFWGYSSSESADGFRYLGWASLEKFTITPHACVLALEDFPKEALEALRAIERAGGRPKYISNKSGSKYNFGFTDSYNIEYSRASNHYLSLDQSMLFLSLANYLFDEVVRTSFKNSKTGNELNQLLHRLDMAEGAGSKK